MLTDDALVQLVLHAKQLGGLLLGEALHGDARPLGEHLGDLLLIDDGRHDVGALAQLVLEAAALGEQIPLLVTQLGGTLELLTLDGLLLLGAHVDETGLDVVDLGSGRRALDAHAAARLVDEVDRLVGQVPVGDVAVCEIGRRDECAVGVRGLVMRLVLLAQPGEDLDRLGHRRLVHLDGLEPPLERRVLLEVLAILLEGRGADRLQLTARQHRLEDAGGVDGALGGAGPDQGVDLVDEQDDVAAGPDLLQHLLEALLEVAAVAGPGDEGAEVEGVEVLALQSLRHIPRHDALGQTLDDGGLADPGLADEDGVVLGAARQDLHDPLDLALAPDDGIQLVVAGQLGVVAAELIEHGGARAGFAAAAAPTRGGAHLAAAAGLLATGPREELDDGLADLVQLGAELLQHLGGDALTLPDETEEDVLGADVVVAELQSLAQRQLENLLGARGEGDVPGRGLGTLADDLDDLRANRLERDAHSLEGAGGDALPFVDEPEEDVLRADVVVIEESGLLLCEDDHPPGPVCETLEQRDSNMPMAPSRGASATIALGLFKADEPVSHPSTSPTTQSAAGFPSMRDTPAPHAMSTRPTQDVGGVAAIGNGWVRGPGLADRRDPMDRLGAS